jgi:hypothetical protein
VTDPRTSGAQRFGSDSELRGRDLKTDYTLDQERQTFRNPGATPDLRGVEPNTNEDKGDAQAEVPMTGETPQPGQIGDEAGPSGSPSDTFAGAYVSPTLGERQSTGPVGTSEGNTNLTYEVPR